MGDGSSRVDVIFVRQIGISMVAKFWGGVVGLYFPGGKDLDWTEANNRI